MAEQRRHIASLDGLRGVAAAAVVWDHMTFQVFNVPTPYRGYLAVDFFFILSGLVVAGAYEARLQGGMSLAGFVKIRLIRLYPLIVLGILCGFVSKIVAFCYFSHQGSGISSGSSIFAAALFGLLLLPYTGMYGVAGEMFPLDVPLWSLMFEVWANIFYAAVARLRRPGLLRIVTSAAILLGGAAIFHFALAQRQLSGGFTLTTFWTGVARVCCAFFIGIALHRVLTPARIAALPAVPFPVLSLLLILVLCAGPGFGPLYDVFAVLVIFPAIVALGAKDCVTAKWRSIALFAGAMSYPVYVLHDATFAHFTHFRGRSGIETFFAFLAAFLAIVGLSYVVLRYYDEPVRRWLTRISRGSVRTDLPVAAMEGGAAQSE